VLGGEGCSSMVEGLSNICWSRLAIEPSMVESCGTERVLLREAVEYQLVERFVSPELPLLREGVLVGLSRYEGAWDTVWAVSTDRVLLAVVALLALLRRFAFTGLLGWLRLPFATASLL